jgi:hypothetical protein
MGMTVVGLPEDMFAFRFVCSSVISDIEYNIMKGLEFNYQANMPNTGHVGPVMTDMISAFLNDTALEAFESNGYIVLKPENRTDLIYLIDPNTGIVRDINTLTNLYGAYCYYNLQTNLAETLGSSLINSESSTFLNNVESASKKAAKEANVNKQFLKELFLNKLPGPGDLPKWIGIVMTLMTLTSYLAEPVYTGLDDISEFVTIQKNNTSNNTTKITIKYNSSMKDDKFV